MGEVQPAVRRSVRDDMFYGTAFKQVAHATKVDMTGNGDEPRLFLRRQCHRQFALFHRVETLIFQYQGLSRDATGQEFITVEIKFRPGAGLLKS